MKIFSLSLNNKKDLENVENETKILFKLNNEYCVLKCMKHLNLKMVFHCNGIL